MHGSFVSTACLAYAFLYLCRSLLLLLLLLLLLPPPPPLLLLLLFCCEWQTGMRVLLSTCSSGAGAGAG
jgi:hypothetical protein